MVKEPKEYKARAEALSAELQNRQPQQAPPLQPQYQPLAQQQYSQAQRQQIFEDYRAAQVAIAEEEKAAVQKYPDYMQQIKKLEPGNKTSISPTSYYHLMLNVSNAPDVAYHLSRHPETVAKCGPWKVQVERRRHARADHISKWSQLSGQRIADRGRVISPARAPGEPTTAADSPCERRGIRLDRRIQRQHVNGGLQQFTRFRLGQQRTEIAMVDNAVKTAIAEAMDQFGQALIKAALDAGRDQYLMNHTFATIVQRARTGNSGMIAYPRMLYFADKTLIVDDPAREEERSFRWLES